MYDWTDVEAARLHRRELLQDAEMTRIIRGNSNDHERRPSLWPILRWELARGFGFAGKALRRPSPRG
jgi:hypothetical protein